MITPKLEQLIHEGKAQYKTFVVGLSGVSVLPIKPGNYIVITDFIYNPFTDVPEADNFANLGDVWKRSNKQIEFRSQKSCNHYIMRDSAPYSFIPIRVDTYLVHERDVTISIGVMPSLTAGTMVLNYGATPTTTDILASPSGYGTLDSVLSAQLTNPTQQYQPTSSINSGIATANDYRVQFKANYDAVSKLTNQNLPAYTGYMKDRAYPILNIGYVYVNEAPTFKIQSS